MQRYNARYLLPVIFTSSWDVGEWATGPGFNNFYIICCKPLETLETTVEGIRN